MRSVEKRLEQLAVKYKSSSKQAQLSFAGMCVHYLRALIDCAYPGGTAGINWCTVPRNRNHGRPKTRVAIASAESFTSD